MTYADLLIAGRVVISFGPDDVPAQALAVRGGQVIALADSLEDLAGLRGPSTRVLDDPDLVVMPGFFDTHNHLVWTGADRRNVDISAARDIEEIVSLLRARASQTPAGQWVVANRSWHESTIRERRLPTAAELDAVSSDHPVFVPRGGHVATANHRALELAGITADTPDPAGGTVTRDGSGEPVGPLIEFPAMAPVLGLLPRPAESDVVEDLRATCQDYAARGLVAVRDPGITRADWDRYLALRRQDELPLRVRALFMLEPAAGAEGNRQFLRSLDVRAGSGDEVLRASGVKLFSDGGVEGGWFTEPYHNQPGYCGHGFYSPEQLEALVGEAVEAGWQVGTHAVGDAAVQMVLDAYEAVLAGPRSVRPHSLVIEHAFMADDEARRRAVKAGIGVTIQHPLLYALAGNMLTHWGSERTERVMPVADWVADGALVAAGSDCNVAPGDPLLSVWGLVTRGTKVTGVQGERFAIDRPTAFALYTYAGWHLMGEHDVRGRLAPGYSADLVVFRDDPMTAPLDDLPGLAPVLTLLEGRPVHDPHGLLSS